MFEQGRPYAPVTTADDGSVTVQLDADHPGAVDSRYRRRRNEIASAALAWESAPAGTAAPRINYTADEHGVWRTVLDELWLKHARLACEDYRKAIAALALPTNKIPQLDEVSARLQPLTGFRYVPAAGLVCFEDFYGSLADGAFHCAQYVRHRAHPLYTPEPDLIHGVVGHGGTLAAPRLAELYRLAGRAARRLQTKAGRDFFSSVFWFTIEFGVVWEHSRLRACGAGLLSSFGEIEEFRDAEIRPLNVVEMGTLQYDASRYQPILFAADGIEQLLDVIGGFFADCDDDAPARLGVIADGRR